MPTKLSEPSHALSSSPTQAIMPTVITIGSKANRPARNVEALSPEGPPSEAVPQERQHRENEEHDEKYLGSFPGEGCHASEAKEGSDQSDDEKHDSKS